MRVWKRISLFLSVLVVLTALYMTPLFGNKPAVIVSGSMEPTIQTGAFILVHFSDFEDCEVGDVITYYHPGFDELVTHRIVEKGKDYYWTKGDANSARDDISVIEDNFYGKVIYTANWLAPLMGRWIADRQLDKAALMSVLIVVGLCVMVACVAISFVATYLYSFIFVVWSKSYSEKTLESLSKVGSSMVQLCHKHTELSTWKRVKLNLTYRVWKRTLVDIEDELKKL
ncbi:signal peptidase I [Flavonifractor plautii]|uniref:signal peptidase I n=1 Tax=Flavonifractor plautii TaxID=292800 RepID=UPI001A9B82A6|nr:signal peptidase I [Flavonifractor plautii]MDB7911454.1 signal peptidase I [Flavonifractor plautii]